MPLTHHDVMTADLSPISDAAEGWRKMGDRFGELKRNYETNVQGALDNGNWQGVAFDTHRISARNTVFEFAAAKKEAHSVAALLKQAHTELTRLQKAAKDLVADAEKKDYKVDGQGRATYVGYDKLTPQELYAFQHDPDHSRLLAQSRAHAQEWTDDIAAAVKAVDDMDQGVKRALARATTDVSPDGSGFGGFNARDVGDLQKAGAPEKADRTELDGWVPEGSAKATGPDAGVTVTGTKYGKEAAVKAYADLFHVNAQGSSTNGLWKLSGVADAYGGARATANFGFTDNGLVGKAETSVGLRGLAEGRVEYGHVGGYGRVEGFAGAEAGVSAGVGPSGLNAGAKAFAGGKVSVAGGGEVAGIGAGGTAEGRYGVGAEAEVTLGKGEDGKYHVGTKVGAALGLGGSVGLEFTVDPKKVSDAASDAADVVGDAAGAVGDAAGAVGDAAGDAAGSVKDTVTSWF
ncbi:hypothetical protein [Streptomyces sp. NPDC048442]|uniref:hypothetical protein n=1 Tax=Streptomyces sp. NPDC048442 TaxID=3154823 RepID=UPI003418A627